MNVTVNLEIWSPMVFASSYRHFVSGEVRTLNCGQRALRYNTKLKRQYRGSAVGMFAVHQLEKHSIASRKVVTPGIGCAVAGANHWHTSRVRVHEGMHLILKA